MEIDRRKFLMLPVALAALLFLPDNLGKKEHSGDNQQTADLPIPKNPIRDLFGALLAPFIKETEKRRGWKLENDPEFINRVNWELTGQRINFLLYGYGETHEPPLTERAKIGSISVFSLDIPTRSIDVVSLTHDIRAPEIERFRRGREQGLVYPTKIYLAFEDGGFPLMGRVIEGATGLSVDFQMAFHDRFIKRMVDGVLNGVEVEVPENFAVHPFYLDGKKYPSRSFKKGRQRMNGLDVLSFIKTVPDTNGGSVYPKNQEHNYRKHLVVEGCTQALKANIANPLFLLRLHNLLSSKSNKDTLDFDFDPQELLFGNLTEVATEAGKSLFSKGEGGIPFTLGDTVYIVDSAHGDGGVQWVTASQSPIIREELRRNLYPDKAMEVPFNGDPNAEDLAQYYWGSVRNLVKKRFQN